MKVIFLIMVLVVSGNLYAEEGQPFGVVGVGTTSCGAVVDALDGGNYQQHYFGFIDGFITGFNYKDGGNLGLSTDSDGRMLFIKNYCNGHPLAPLVRALIELEKELRKRQLKLIVQKR